MATEIYIEKNTGYMEAMDFEVYDLIGTIQLLRKYRPVMYTAVGVYLLGIYLGRKWMENREPFELKIPLFLWNLGLAIFSMMATARLMPEVSYLLRQPDGLYLSICLLNPHNYAPAFWGLMFILSKFLELGDTAFIILRKQKLIVLHWFHHVATLIICWIGYETYDSASRYIFLNTFVHSFMYLYYALKALKIKIPKKFSQALTTIQITQLVGLLYVMVWGSIFIVQGRPCRIDRGSLKMGAVVVFIFVLLFINFFWKTYYSPKGKAQRRQRVNEIDAKNASLRKEQ